MKKNKRKVEAKETKLFHKDVYMPEEFTLQAMKLQKEFDKYELSAHFASHLTRSDKNRSHDYNEDIIKAIDSIKKNVQPPFEVEVTKIDSSWIVNKYCVRIPFDEKNDAVIVVQPYYAQETKEYVQTRNLIRTAWFNSGTDNHQTLDDSKYVKKEEWK